MGRRGAVRAAAAARGYSTVSASARKSRWGHRQRGRGADVTAWIVVPQPACRLPRGASSEAAGGQSAAITAAPIATACTTASDIPVPSFGEPHGVQGLGFHRGSHHE